MKTVVFCSFFFSRMKLSDFSVINSKFKCAANNKNVNLFIQNVKSEDFALANSDSQALRDFRPILNERLKKTIRARSRILRTSISEWAKHEEATFNWTFYMTRELTDRGSRACGLFFSHSSLFQRSVHRNVNTIVIYVPMDVRPS